MNTWYRFRQVDASLTRLASQARLGCRLATLRKGWPRGDEASVCVWRPQLVELSLAGAAHCPFFGTPTIALQ
eukprot:3308675-Prymnesium_polylepis.1